MRDSMIFYRSFYEAIKELSFESQGIIYNAIYEYGLNKNEVELKGIEKTIFTLIKPQLDANLRKFNNGNKGGRPPKNNLNETELKPKNNLNETKTKANVNVNDNVNDNDNNKFDFKKSLLSFGFNSDLISEWLKIRKNKKLTNSEVAYKDFIKQVEINGQDKNYILEQCVIKSWGGFKSDWLPKQNIQSNVNNNVLFVTPEGIEITDKLVLHTYQQTGFI